MRCQTYYDNMLMWFDEIGLFSIVYTRYLKKRRSDAEMVRPCREKYRIMCGSKNMGNESEWESKYCNIKTKTERCYSKIYYTERRSRKPETVATTRCTEPK